ncbi:hypothetical protein ACFC26_14930 [Kitasatospora purpeofusca]|uniref:hypothetical protein n=1 Tax=Kitasatospora purpeofusca TaxID=67352 RepID=UPI0035DB4841
MPEPRPRLPADQAHDATLRMARAIADLRELLDDLDLEESADMLLGVFLPPGPVHALAGLLQRFAATAADNWSEPSIHEPLLREGAELTLGAYRVAAVADRIVRCDVPAARPRYAAARASSPAAQAAGPAAVLHQNGPVEAVRAAVTPHPRIAEPPAR